jgi:hypothetical protein
MPRRTIVVAPRGVGGRGVGRLCHPVRDSLTAGYLDVLPALRVRGYVDDILGEITHVHALDGADRITATTDVSNTPMVAAFDRANYRVTEVRIVFTAPTG